MKGPLPERQTGDHRLAQKTEPRIAIAKLPLRPNIYGMIKNIGIVGCSAEGAALCFKTICVEGARHLGAHAHKSPCTPILWPTMSLVLRITIWRA
jgi:hypothetical protein